MQKNFPAALFCATLAPLPLSEIEQQASNGMYLKRQGWMSSVLLEVSTVHKSDCVKQDLLDNAEIHIWSICEWIAQYCTYKTWNVNKY